MLGTELSLLFEKNGFPFVGTDKEIDITNPEALENFITKQPVPFSWIINCAAYTAVDKAEDEKEICSLLNVKGAENIANTARKTGAALIHISTDYVFNGKERKPYTEEDKTDPIGVYGLSKRDGENKVLKANKKSFIIRTAWLYGKYGNNFVHTMLKYMNEKESVSVVNDQYGSPTWTFDLSQIIITMIQQIEKGKNIPYGIYHFTNEGEITWFDFACEIYAQARSLGILTKTCEVKSCTSAEFPAKVTRPAYSMLDKTKIKKNLNTTIPEWKDSLQKYLLGEKN